MAREEAYEDGEETHLLEGALKQDRACLRVDVRGTGHFVAAILALVLLDKWLLTQCVAAGITFPSSLIGMFMIFTVLTSLSASGLQEVADWIDFLFEPALVWLARWLPLFYIPGLVTFPLVLTLVAVKDLAKAGVIIFLGMPFTLFMTGSVVVFFRRISSVSVLPAKPAANIPPFTIVHVSCCSAVASMSFVASFALPSGSLCRWARVFFLLAATAFGLIICDAAPEKLRGVLPHPIVATVISGSSGCAMLAAATGSSYFAVLRDFLTHGSTYGEYGAGDWLMSFLGCVLLSFGFHIYRKRDLLARHFVEVIGACATAPLLSMVATTIAGRVLGLPPLLSLAITPRSITVALAMPIAGRLGVPAELIPLCAGSVVCTGLLGGASVLRLMNSASYSDPVVRGLSTGSAAMGMGAAVLAKQEAAALPFCALAYGLVGIAASTWVELPAVRAILIFIAGT
eukprot:TRINITY_DN15686_c0_g2_i1.p1 TRINITY_DN15686_c0_g2~~TRINITY_DN15686_c0_g2_i1.p1  ORF type:complete len:457 (+),score=33.96 TRINITY_DN15686_c0_g2_i1:75-1445(+)